MGSSVYKIIEVVGTSSSSWEAAAENAVEVTGMSVKDLRVAEVDRLDVEVEDGKVVAFRARVMISFRVPGLTPLPFKPL